MNKKILAIVASPTRDHGYTYRSVQVIETALSRHDDTDIEYVHLVDRPFSPLGLGGRSCRDAHGATSLASTPVTFA